MCQAWSWGQKKVDPALGRQDLHFFSGLPVWVGRILGQRSPGWVLIVHAMLLSLLPTCFLGSTGTGHVLFSHNGPGIQGRSLELFVPRCWGPLWQNGETYEPLPRAMFSNTKP